MNDVLPDEAALWEASRTRCADVFRAVRLSQPARAAGRVHAALRARDRRSHRRRREGDVHVRGRLNGDSLTLRPEATAGIVRAAIEHNLTYERPQRVWLAGPMFRHERPQKGRYRQFHQFDVEALASPVRTSTPSRW
jgi:histidyl-tRNA synthetase